MIKSVAVIGAGAEGLRLWEVLTHCGSVDVVAFVEADTRLHGRMRAGIPIHSPRWLTAFTGDVVTGATGARQAVGGGLVSGPRLISLPTHLDDENLALAARSAYPDPLATLIAAPCASARTSVGIFGTGTAATRVWEAVSDIDALEPVWFADNNVQRQGQAFLWLPVIAPSTIPSHHAEFVIIGSMSRDPILRQLLGLGVPASRILSPDVCADVASVRTELCRLVEAACAREVPV